MRLFLSLALLLILIPTVAGATPITRQTAEAYFQNCMQQPSQPGLTQTGKNNLCACTAAKMMQSLSVEDVQMMGGQDQNARNAMNKMIVHVYAPCIQYPAKDHYYHTCVTNPQTKKLGRNPQKLCGCMASQVASYLGSNGQQVFQNILSRNPNIADPMSALTSDQEFQSFAQSKLLGCVM
ncbi:MAG: hypothetical protein MRY79_07800 [Alphaproteobacteria bacterium]|nr:hypothetical protein [Alphaproteobacteria bacterium]